MSPTIDRRRFITLAGASALGLSLWGCSRNPYAAAEGGRVIVGGAGLSGLTAALLLEERGVDVTVIEGRDRLGGRVFTLENVPGRPEGGGPTIASSYKRLLKLAEYSGVPMQPGPSFDPQMLLHVGGEAVPVEAWATAPANRTVGAERNIPPPLLLGFYISQDVPISGAGAWMNPANSALDIPLDKLLRQRGASDEALRLINIAPNTNDIATTSALWALRNAQRRRDAHGASMLGATGGNSRIIEGLARGVEGDVLTGMPITGVSSAEQGVTVTCADGSAHKADYCLLTMPFSVLRGIRFDPPMEGPQREAVSRLPYTAITKYYFAPKGHFWEEDGMAPTMWTDSIIERVFPTRDEQGRVVSLTVWVDGANAQKLDALPAAEQLRVVVDEFTRMRPAADGKLEFIESISWGKDPFALGAYAHYAPGQATGLRPTMAAPWKRIHFAGEHTAIASPGMESAVESAERAVDEVLARYV